MKKYMAPEIVIAKLSEDDVIAISLPFVPIGRGVLNDEEDDNGVFGN